MFTVNLAWELRDTKITVNSICPGFTATDLNNNGTQSVKEGATAIVRYAQQTSDGPLAASSTTTAVTPGSSRLWARAWRSIRLGLHRFIALHQDSRICFLGNL